MNLRYEFHEDGGYDCMTDAIDIYDGDRRIAEIDLALFGQKRGNCSNEADARAAYPKAFEYADALTSSNG